MPKRDPFYQSMIDRRKEVDRRMVEVKAEIARIEEERKRPAELAAELAELQSQSAWDSLTGGEYAEV